MTPLASLTIWKMLNNRGDDDDDTSGGYTNYAYSPDREFTTAGNRKARRAAISKARKLKHRR